MASTRAGRDAGRPPQQGEEAALAARLRQQAAVAELGELALRPMPIPELMQAVSECVAATLGAPLAKVLELEPGGEALLLRAGVGWKKGWVGAARAESDRGSQAGYTLRSSAPVVVGDLVRETRFHAPRILREHGVRSGVSVVLGPLARPFGVLAVHDTHPDRFSEDDARFLQSAATLLALALRRRETEEGLRRSEARYRALAENASDLIEEVSAEGRFVFTSPNHLEHFGWSPEELESIDPFSLIDESDRPRVRDLFDRTVAQGSAAASTFRVRRRDGALRWYEAHGRAVEGSEGPGMVLVLRDATARVEAERELAESVARFRALQDNAGDIIAELDAEGRYLSVNPSFQALLGWSPDEALAMRDPFVLVRPEDRERVRGAFVSLLRRGGPARLEYRVARRDDATLWLEANANTYRARDGSTRVVLIARDVTARKEAETALRESEEHLRRSQRLEAVGRLSGGVAHDFNNMLTVISGYCDLLASRLPEEHPDRAVVEEIQGAQGRAASLTRQLLAFARAQHLRPRPLDLSAAIREVEPMLRSLAGEAVGFEVDLERDLDAVLADPAPIEQAVVNLVINARDALSEGGTIRLATHAAELGRAEAEAAELAPGRYAALTVSDTGTGMDAETLARVFEPFFSTKPTGGGSGLGLASVYGAVRQTGGGMAVESAPGQGSTFRLYLPFAEDVEPALGVEEEPPAPPAPERGTVLVCEDEPAVRSLLESLLRNEGYAVLVARDAEEALERLRVHERPIHLLMTDVVMPRASGPELAARALALRPGLRLLYVSGHSEAEAGGRHGPEGRRLAKPFSAAELRRAVRAALGSAPPRPDTVR